MWLAIIAAVASGAMAATAHWPLEWHWLAWVAFVPWLVVMPRLRADQVWLMGSLVGAVYYAVCMYWLPGVVGPGGAALWFILGVWMGFAFRVAKLLTERLGPATILWAAPLAFVGHEYARSEGLPRLRTSFDVLGYGQSANLWIAQIASLGGVYFVAFMVVAVNAAIAYALIRRGRRAWAPALAVGALTLLLGFLSQPGPDDSAPDVSVACVQEEQEKGRDYLPFIRYTAEALADPSGPRFVVLPEHTILEPTGAEHPVAIRLGELAREHNAYVCVGAHVQPESGGDCPFDNVAMTIGPDGSIVHMQPKGVPVPRFVGDGNPARSQTTFETPHGRVGTYVCYDGTFTDWPRRLHALGAELILAPVMDPIRWPLQQRRQHAAIAPFRSIELRRWVVRGSSSGVSQIVAPTGEVTEMRTSQDGPGLLFGKVRFLSGDTVFTHGGYLFAPAACIAFLLAVVILTTLQMAQRVRCGPARIGSWRRAGQQTQRPGSLYFVDDPGYALRVGPGPSARGARDPRRHVRST